MQYEDLTGHLKTLYDFHFNNGTITIEDGTYTLQEILDKDDDWWNGNHDFIQWIYPTDELSKFNRDSPVLTKEFTQLFRESSIKINPIMYRRFGDFIRRTRCLDGEFNHNFLRYSRVLRNIALLTSNKMSLDIFKFYSDKLNLLRLNTVDSYKIWLDATQAKFED
jgi:hypothetical protein